MDKRRVLAKSLLDIGLLTDKNNRSPGSRIKTDTYYHDDRVTTVYLPFLVIPVQDVKWLGY